jgi:hypothetical protein
MVFSGFKTVCCVYNHSNSVCIPMVQWFRARTSSNKLIEKLVENAQSNIPHIREKVEEFKCKEYIYVTSLKSVHLSASH